MPTNDERREVAENLRTMCCLGCRYAEQFYELLNETVMREWDFHSFQDVADRLADLIEPEERTCLVESTRTSWNEGHQEWIHGLSCGHVAYGEESEPPNYCCVCGAKVVEE